MLVQINLIGNDLHSIFNLACELAYLIEFFKVKFRFSVEVYKLILFILQYLLNIVTDQILQRGFTNKILFCLFCSR